MTIPQDCVLQILTWLMNTLCGKQKYFEASGGAPGRVPPCLCEYIQRFLQKTHRKSCLGWRDELAKEFQRIISGVDVRISQSPLGGYIPYEQELIDDSYFLSEEQLKKCLGITQVQENE